MKRKMLRSFMLVVFGLGIAVSAHHTNEITAKAVTSTVREATERLQNGQVINHYYYYGNGAIRSVNNKVSSTYNFTEDSFVATVSSYSDQLLGEVNYDDTREVWEKVGADNLSKLDTILKMPTKKQTWFTNYTDDELRALMISLSNTNGTDDNVIDTEEASTSELVSYLSFLIEKDYYTIPQNLKVTKTHDKQPLEAKLTNVSGKENWYYTKNKSDTLNNIKKSDMIMILSKIFCGIQNSSAIVVRDYSERNGTIWTIEDITREVSRGSNYSKGLYVNLDGTAYYGSTYNIYDSVDDIILSSGYDYHGVQFVGDYWVYYDPNVYELYLSQALRDGIITVSDLDSKNQFRIDYKNRTTGTWGNGGIRVNNEISKNCLGYSKIATYDGHQLLISQQAPNYFGAKEDMTMMEALRLIEAYMRANDENMPETEENIVRYKLGLSVLSSMNNDDRSTVTYLIAKGILDGSSSYLNGMLYEDATIARIYPLLYRAANKEARYDFCTIQLTDSETFWASENFSSNSFHIFMPDHDIIHELESVTEGTKRTNNDKNTIDANGDKDDVASLDYQPNNKRSSPLNNLLAATKPLEVNAATKSNGNTVSTYTVVMYFDKQSVYCLGNTTIGKLAAPNANPKPNLKDYGITKIEDKKLNYNGKDTEVYMVTFEISANSNEAAVKAVNDRITVRADVDKYSKVVNGVTQVGTDDELTNLISQKSLKQAFSNITVLEDKVLMNSKTGTLAYFSYDNKLAIVGSQIIESNYSCITKTADDVFYDLQAILPLLSSAYVDIIGTQASVVRTDIDKTKSIKIATDRTDASDYLLNAQYVKMLVCDLNTTDEDKNDREGVGCIYTKKAKEASDKDKKHEASTEFFLKLNTLSNTANNLTKSFSVDYNGTTVTGTLIVDLQYLVPDIEDFPNWLDERVNSDTVLTYAEASEMLFTPPDKIEDKKGSNYTNNSLLKHWWYSNYVMSNELCNFMYGTQANVYVPSGYMCPSVTVLVDNVGRKSFSEWCKEGANKKNSKVTETELRNLVLDKVFSKFEFGGGYLPYNCGKTNRIWSNYFQCDADTIRPSDIGFDKADNTDSVSTLLSARTFTIYEEQSEKVCKGIKIGEISKNQKLKVYGTRYAVSSNGCVYQRVDTVGGDKKSLFKCTYNKKNSEKTSIKSLTLKSRTADKGTIRVGTTVTVNKRNARYDGTATANDVKYFTVCPASLWQKNGELSVGCYDLKLIKNQSDNKYYLQYNGSDIDNSKVSYPALNFLSTYAANNTTVLGKATLFKTSELPKWTQTFKAWLQDGKTRILVDPSQHSGILKSLLGTKECYVYTDFYEDTADSDLLPCGRIYQWTGSKLKKVTKVSSLDSLADTGTPIYAIGRFFTQADQTYFTKNDQKNWVLGYGMVSKALNYMQYDMTSINNQLIEAYLTEQQGVTSIKNLPKDTELTIGDTVWVKNGEWWQSKPIKDLNNIKAVISSPNNLSSYMNTLFNGLYITVQGKQYPVIGYVKESKLGSVTGTNEQKQFGVVFMSGNTAKVVKINKNDRETVKNAKNSTSAGYFSIKCKFNDSMLARPLDADKTKYIYLGHSGLSMISSADYPFFDMEASWNKSKNAIYYVNNTKFKPSPAYEQAKENFLSEFRAEFVSDTWRFAWVMLALLASYLLVMTWFAYGVLTLGVGRAGFAAMELRDKSGKKNGVDLIKLATFGMYSLDKELSLGRMIVVSFGCCIVIVTVLILF